MTEVVVLPIKKRLKHLNVVHIQFGLMKYKKPKILSFSFHSFSSLQEIKALPYVKQSLADKIWEIIRTKELVKLSAFQSRDDVTTCKITQE
jgi:hypothetical protein